MDLFDKAAKIMSGYDSLGKDHSRAHVQRGVGHFLDDKLALMHYQFKISGLGLQGLMYFAMREYYGCEEAEADMIKILIDNYTD